jgi:hypothetical protein
VLCDRLSSFFTKLLPQHELASVYYLLPLRRFAKITVGSTGVVKFSTVGRKNGHMQVYEQETRPR